ncbi:sigma-E factor negative regulatory protein [Microbulbifer thermotolerans]|uniref:Sigma-E factor negative regulatory protein n=2 Tax=Microbulbifer thermotolerans TaxID=252514 RepID=A0AB35HV59_MICTH|nr:sigma-E factor negative regulatory protein [Microbulbifer thermotolerans]MCX2793640.1 sigma-E factor negative regulatory protein [Microbulbifer thermotolerans]MCX2800824.1 sigma-E factor negative regulatory protein [Microbulbifer thermotolerans]MCX2832914.1 sigma-E factor negative regulatory protein [Microbulbifer thermotolerans]WKT61844.1 sigma-E factor negative regulatory protein [Microbulbifer thermotolerans]SFB75900.1 sigma-E factor negative regulatory protein RseA [Microbulbifer thermo
MSHGKHQERLYESLSALMDGEVGELELQRLLKASAASSEVGARWSRYQLAASVLRREQIAPVDGDLAARISAAIEREEPPMQSGGGGGGAPGGWRDSRWWRPMSRGAVAATVAFAAILGVQQISSVQRDSGTELVAEVERPAQQPVQSASQPSGFYVPAPSARSVSTASPRLVPDYQPGGSGQAVIQQVPTPELMRHLNRVMIQHSEQAAHVGSQGMVPFARATYGEQLDM